MNLELEIIPEDILCEQKPDENLYECISDQIIRAQKKIDSLKKNYEPYAWDNPFIGRFYPRERLNLLSQFKDDVVFLQKDLLQDWFYADVLLIDSFFGNNLSKRHTYGINCDLWVKPHKEPEMKSNLLSDFLLEQIEMLEQHKQEIQNIHSHIEKYGTGYTVDPIDSRIIHKDNLSVVGYTKFIPVEVNELFEKGYARRIIIDEAIFESKSTIKTTSKALLRTMNHQHEKTNKKYRILKW